MRRSFPLFPAMMLALLGGCAGLDTLTRVTTPTELFSLTPKSTFSTSLPRIDQQIVVEVPTATAAVDTDQVAVMPNPLQVQYLPEVRWVDRAPLIVQSLLIESYENSNKVSAVGRSTVGLRADYTIITDIREFQARLPDDGSEDDPLEVNVRLNIKVVDAFTDQIIGSKSFDKVRKSEGDEMLHIAQAFDAALGSAMRDAVEWSIRRIHSHAAENPRPDF